MPLVSLPPASMVRLHCCNVISANGRMQGQDADSLEIKVPSCFGNQVWTLTKYWGEPLSSTAILLSHGFLLCFLRD